jgi:hypothetical protein
LCCTQSTQSGNQTTRCHNKEKRLFKGNKVFTVLLIDLVQLTTNSLAIATNITKTQLVANLTSNLQLGGCDELSTNNQS